ncbi:uncharacterized protein LOC116768257 isoform X2 [Danaus plexippus]|uniref:uncharacterized protein LOC116768257 isoform X2 n=1 Tax=Danaus plexippus TaxID=13037 RepID=UPI002AB0FC40|nr:uncharacterized protein LOC116768257 isoform X2 [Danaus plexippus]
MPFIDIAFQAEVSRFEDQEFEECARRNCSEDPETRQTAIHNLRNLIYQRGECNPRRLDDAYLLRFLRCRRFIPALAHKLIVRYEEFRRKNSYLYDCKAFGLQKVKGVYGGTLPESPHHGRITLMRSLGHGSRPRGGRGPLRSADGRDRGHAAQVTNPRRHHHSRPRGSQCETCQTPHTHYSASDRQPHGGVLPPAAARPPYSPLQLDPEHILLRVQAVHTDCGLGEGPFPRTRHGLPPQTHTPRVPPAGVRGLLPSRGGGRRVGQEGRQVQGRLHGQRAQGAGLHRRRSAV